MKSLLKSPWFLAGLFLRLALSPFFGSHYIRDLFVPFLDNAVQHFGSNPWSMLPPHYFPYGTVLFTILYLPRVLAHAIFGAAALGTGPLGLFLIRGPLLGLDILLFLTMRHFTKERARKLLWLYWLNPIVIYITYFHGQLDVAATAFCILSLTLLTSRKIAASAVSLALATLCKFHVVAIIPFMIVYLWNRLFIKSALRDISKWFLIYATLVGVGFVPLLFARQFMYASTSSPEALRIFSANFNFGSGQVLYLGLLGVLATLGRLCVSTRISERGLVFGSGIIFGALILVTNTAPGWYYWVLPFVSLLYALYENVPKSLYFAFNVFYLVYFLAIQDFALSTNEMLSGVAFTLLQTSLAGILIAMWNIVVRKEVPAARRARPVVIGLSGDSGTGKNYFSKVLCDLFDPKNTLVIEGDDYHRWERGSDHWEHYTHLNPKANHLLKMSGHALQLAQGMPITHSQYDHSHGRFTETREITPQRTMIVQGLHTLYLRGMRDHLDLKIFLAPDDSIRLAWKLQRDVLERGHSIEKVLNSLKDRESDSRLHIDPQREFADWIIEYFPIETISKERILAGEFPALGVRHIIWNDAPVLGMLESIRESLNCRMDAEIVPDNIDRIAIKILGSPTAASVSNLASELFPNLRHITRGRNAPIWHDGYNGINQLISLALMNEKIGRSVYEDLH